MDSFYRKAIVLASALALALVSGGYAQDTLFPAIISFGDSSVDVGNNNHLSTIFKANYPPYGRDFANHKPTGRFCNGKLTIDITGKCKIANSRDWLSYVFRFTCLYMKHILTNLRQFLYAAEALGFKTYAPAYLSPEASGKNLLIGVNFASAASGYDDKTAFLNVS